MIQILEHAINEICLELFSQRVEARLTRTNEQFGDYSTNIALYLAGKINKNSIDIANQIVAKLENHRLLAFKPAVAGLGFINLHFSDQAIWDMTKLTVDRNLEDKSIIVEYLDPNPFKEIHIGHAYSGTIGDAIASLFELRGANVHRVTYQGDVGLHVAKALYGILLKTDNDVTKLSRISNNDKSNFLGSAYVLGSTAYDNDQTANKRIVEINIKVYDRSDKLQNQVYEICKAWSLEYFDDVYKKLGFNLFEKNYMESEVAEEGKQLVLSNIKNGIFQESEGAVIFDGDKFGLHKRVFINSKGLPTYEAKDLGNAAKKWRDFHYYKSVVITGHEQAEYFKVMLKALEQFEPDQAKSTTHIAHGMVKLSSGKMSSRKGNVVKALDVLEVVKQSAKLSADEDADDVKINDVSLAAMKYAFLKNRIGSDVAFDINESVAVEGNSGPYLQYAHARARSILAKTGDENVESLELQPAERSLLRKIGEFTEVVNNASEQLMPHLICTYLYELAQVFNRFYESNRVIGHERQALRKKLVHCYADVLKKGLQVLNIPAPERI